MYNSSKAIQKHLFSQMNAVLMTDSHGAEVATSDLAGSIMLSQPIRLLSLTP